MSLATRLGAAAIAGCTLLGGAGCGSWSDMYGSDDDCELASVSCVGNTLTSRYTCTDGDGSTNALDCGSRYCRIVDTTSGPPSGVCSISSDRDPRCAQNGWTCSGEQLLLCSLGYVMEVHTCASADRCDAGIGGCLAKPGLDPLCPPRYVGPTCDGSLLIECNNGYRIREHDCGCVDDHCEDPRCAGVDYLQVCYGAERIVCRDGALVAEEECEGGGCASGSCWQGSPDFQTHEPVARPTTPVPSSPLHLTAPPGKAPARNDRGPASPCSSPQLCDSPQQRPPLRLLAGKAHRAAE